MRARLINQMKPDEQACRMGTISPTLTTQCFGRPHMVEAGPGPSGPLRKVSVLPANDGKSL